MNGHFAALVLTRSLVRGLALAAGLTAPALSAMELDYQLRGFASQSFVHSQGNNLFGDSTGGSFEFYEVGAGGSLVVGHRLLLSAQALLRDAGQTDNDGLRLDYALADFKLVNRPALDLGLRIGRVKNPFGLYNETRDVVFTRPGILLPQSLYFDGQGFRRVLFSSDGGQLYGGFNRANHEVRATIGSSRARNASEQEERQLFGAPFAGNLRVTNFQVAQLEDEIANGRWRLLYSYFQNHIRLQPEPGMAVDGELKFQIHAVSVQHNLERLSLTSEYRMTRSRGQIGSRAPFESVGDGGYLQAEYRFRPHWSALARYDLNYVNQGDRGGRDYATRSGGSRYSQYSKDATLGVNWLPDKHWGVWAEFHLIEGTSSVAPLDNQGRTPDSHWNALLVTAAYRY